MDDIEENTNDNIMQEFCNNIIQAPNIKYKIIAPNDNNAIRNSFYRNNELIKSTNQLFNIDFNLDNTEGKNYTVIQMTQEEIENYINDIKLFWTVKNDHSLDKLQSIIEKNSKKDTIIRNLNGLHNNNFVKDDEYEEILKFLLYLNMSVLEKHYEIYNIDYDASAYDNYVHYNKILLHNTYNFVTELTKLLIKKYFNLNAPITWITKQELCTKITK